MLDSNLSYGNSSVNTTQLVFSNWTTAKSVVFVTMYSIVLVISTAGNGAVLLVLHRQTNRRYPVVSNLFLLNMIISDLLITLFNIPVLIKNIIAPYEWPLTGLAGTTLCSLTTLLFYLSIDVSLLSLVAVSVDRFLLVFFPYKRFITLKTARVIVGLIWTTGIVFTIPLVLTTKLEKSLWQRSCIVGVKLRTPHPYLVTYFVTFVMLPLLTILALYPAIAVKLWHRKIPGNQSQINQRNRLQQNRKILTMFVTVVFFFSLCWVPYWSAVIACDENAHTACFLLSYFRVLAFSNCALNPIVYVLFNNNIKNGLHQLFRNKCRAARNNARKRTNQIQAINRHCMPSLN